MNYPTKFWFSSLCQQGAKRENIEDSLFVRNFTNERFAVFGVSDGMGGLELGETASLEVCRIFNAQIIKHPEQELKCRANVANLKLFMMDERLGTTLSTMVIDKQKNIFYALSVGDSRIYKYTKFELHQISVDDTPEDTMGKYDNRITNAIGLRKTLPNIDIISGSTNKGDSWLLTTDGIHSFVDNKSIKETLQIFRTGNVLNELAKQAINRGSGDDISAIFCAIL